MDSFLFCVLLFPIVFLCCLFMAIRSRRAFEERHPPLSDAEFVARCTPGIDPSVALKVRRIVAEHFDVEYERVHPSTRFIEDLGAD